MKMYDDDEEKVEDDADGDGDDGGCGGGGVVQSRVSAFLDPSDDKHASGSKSTINQHKGKPQCRKHLIWWARPWVFKPPNI